MRVKGASPVTLRQGQDQHARPDSYDVLVLDAVCKQSLASVRSLGRAGLRVAVGESAGQYPSSLPIPAFCSRYSAHNLVLPSYTDDAARFANAIVEFVRDHPTRVLLPTADESIAAMAPRRGQLAALGCVLALAPDSALDIANDKNRTLEIARGLGIDQPKSMLIESIEDLHVALAEFDFPFVLKPTMSWTGKTTSRLGPTDVVDKDEAVEATERFLAGGSPVLAQQWASGRREGVTLFIVDGEVLAGCGHVAHRTSPQLGGASVVRESIPLPADIYDSAVRLAGTIGIQGACEVEFRRDADNRALLMEINPRLAGTIENAVQAGVDFPLMIWQWATGQRVAGVEDYRPGIRTRWLHGDFQWLRDNQGRSGRPDSVSRTRGFWTFASEFARTRHYDYLDRRDLRPAMAELRKTAGSVRRSWTQTDRLNESGPKKGALNVKN